MTDRELAQQFIDQLERLRATLGLPGYCDALQETDFNTITHRAFAESHFLYAVPRYMQAEDCHQILRSLSAPV